MPAQPKPPARDKQLHNVQATCKQCGKFARFGVLTKAGFICNNCYDKKESK